MTTDYTLARRNILLAALLVVLIVLLNGGMAIYVATDPSIRTAMLFRDVAYTIQHIYPEPVNLDTLTNNAINGMFEHLDRFSSYVEPWQFRQMDEEEEGSYGGIGVTIIRHADGLQVQSVRENGPASRAGIANGDILLKADSVDLAGSAMRDASSHLRGEEGTTVRITLFRPATGDTLATTVTRAKIDLVHIPFAGITPDSLLYVRILDFDAGVSDELRAALDSLLNKPGGKPHGLIIDLRNNPGGQLNEAIKTAELLLNEGDLVVGLEGRSRWREDEYRTKETDITGGLPIAIVVDRGSASASEIVAGALRQNKRAILVGDTTFGKGLVQGFTRWPDGSGTRLTISRYYLEGKVFLNALDSVLHDTGQGLAPDYPLQFREETPFVRAIEIGGLLFDFTARHQDAILAQSDHADMADAWIDSLYAYAEQSGFSFRSPLTESARQLVIAAAIDSASPATFRVINQLVDRVKSLDHEQFHQNGRYIRNRLREIAVTRARGEYAGYVEVIKSDPDIAAVGKILREHQQ